MNQVYTEGFPHIRSERMEDGSREIVIILFSSYRIGHTWRTAEKRQSHKTRERSETNCAVTKGMYPFRLLRTHFMSYQYEKTVVVWTGL